MASVTPYIYYDDSKMTNTRWINDRWASMQLQYRKMYIIDNWVTEKKRQKKGTESLNPQAFLNRKCSVAVISTYVH